MTDTVSMREQYYSRVVRIVGDHFTEKVAHIINVPFVSSAVELLASCGLLKYSFSDVNTVSVFHRLVWSFQAEPEFEEQFFAYLRNKNQFEDRWQFLCCTGTVPQADIIIGGGSLADCLEVYAEAQKHNVPGIFGMLRADGSAVIGYALPGELFPWLEELTTGAQSPSWERYYDWQDLNNQIANIAKALLLRGTPFQREDIERLIGAGKRTLFLQHPSWPWVNAFLDLHNSAEDTAWLQESLDTGGLAAVEDVDFRDKTVLIIGLGSLGSLIAEHFARKRSSIVGIDFKEVSLFNPVRQIYGTEHVGMQKSIALSKILTDKMSSPMVAGEKKTFIGFDKEIENSEAGEAFMDMIINAYHPDLIVLATAHPSEVMVTDLARRRGIPHIVTKCYPRARWFEITVVDPFEGPCFSCLQSRLYTGAAASLTEEQIAAYTTDDTDHMLQAEPATRIETGRCVDIAARLGSQLMQEYEDRAPWFNRMLEEQRTCLIGGNYSEYRQSEQGDGEWTYGVEVPGAVALYGVKNFLGSETEKTVICRYCGRVNDVAIRRVNKNTTVLSNEILEALLHADNKP